MRGISALSGFLLLACGPAPDAGIETAKASDAVSESIVPAGSLTDADRSELAAVTSAVADGREVYPGLPNPPIASCSTADDETLCQHDQLKLVREWKTAHGGDYAAQRNIAYCLATGCDGWPANDVQACGWRMVIIDAADPRVGPGDVANMETECGRLTSAGRSAAASQAARIAETIAAQQT